MGLFSRSSDASDPTEKCRTKCAQTFEQRKVDIQKTHASLRYAQSHGASAQEIASVQAVIDRFAADNEAMVRARAAEAVYDPTKSAECTTNLSADSAKLNNTLGLPPDTLRKEDFVDEKSGFRAALYRSESNGRYILAFAGTDPNALSDWDNNIDNGKGADPMQYKDARNLAKKLKDYGIDFDIAGHSKGGGMATDAGLIAENSNVWTFNSAGLPADALERSGASPEALASLSKRTQAFHTDGDFLTALQTEKDPQKQIENAKNLKAMLEGKTAHGALKITKMNPADTDKDQLEADKKELFDKIDAIISQAESDKANNKPIDPFPTAVGQPHVLGAGYKPSSFLKEVRPLIRHKMRGQLGTNGVMEDLEGEKDADQKTMSRFRSNVMWKSTVQQLGDLLKR